MIYYFKYDNGNAFTLNGNDYSGYFHVLSGVAYSEKKPTNKSAKLTPKSIFLTELFLKETIFDGNFEDLTIFTPNAFDILDETNLNYLFQNINDNNLKIFKTHVYLNPEFIKYDYNNNHFYTLSSTELDIRTPDDIPTGKNVYTHSDPFSGNPDWAFLDTITDGFFVMGENESFVYYCMNNTNTYSIGGDFVNKEAIQLLTQSPNENVLRIDGDYSNNELYYYHTDKISIYDFSKYAICGSLTLKDSLSTTITPETKNFFKMGSDKRTEVKDNIIYIKNRYSNEIYQTVTYFDLGISSIKALDIRKNDDAIILIGNDGDSDYFIFFDVEDVTNSLQKTQISTINVVNNLSFSTEDSDVFLITHTVDTEKRIESRIISNPDATIGVTGDVSYFYLRDYLWKDTLNTWNTIQIKHNSNAMQSNRFNNLTFNTVQNNGHAYSIVHNIGRIYASKGRYDMYSSTIDTNLAKKFKQFNCSGNSIGIAFNIGILNLIKDLLSLYTTAYQIKDYKSIKNITVDDYIWKITNISIDKNELLWTTRDSSKVKKSTDPRFNAIPIENLIFELENTLINGNETINIVSIQRIFLAIVAIQSKILNLV
jgi:hypothetical protein